jgi:hypothetical protein
MAVQIGWYGVQVEDRSRCFLEESVGLSFIGLGLRTRVERGGEDGVDNDRWGRFQDRIRPFDGFLNSGADVVVVDLQELLIEEIPVSLFPFHGRIIPLDQGAVYGQRRTDAFRAVSLGRGAIRYFKDGTDEFKYQGGGLRHSTLTRLH